MGKIYPLVVPIRYAVYNIKRVCRRDHGNDPHFLLEKTLERVIRVQAAVHLKLWRFYRYCAVAITSCVSTHTDRHSWGKARLGLPVAVHNGPRLI